MTIDAARVAIAPPGIGKGGRTMSFAAGRVRPTWLNSAPRCNVWRHTLQSYLRPWRQTAVDEAVEQQHARCFIASLCSAHAHAFCLR